MQRTKEENKKIDDRLRLFANLMIDRIEEDMRKEKEKMGEKNRDGK